MFSIFGWSYPPGCSGPPDDEYPCEVCGKMPDDCLCPECPVCGEYGNPCCYSSHGLILSKSQVDSHVEYLRIIREDKAREAEHWSEYEREMQEAEQYGMDH